MMWITPGQLSWDQLREIRQGAQPLDLTEPAWASVFFETNQSVRPSASWMRMPTSLSGHGLDSLSCSASRSIAARFGLVS